MGIGDSTPRSETRRFKVCITNSDGSPLPLSPDHHFLSSLRKTFVVPCCTDVFLQVSKPSNLPVYGRMSVVVDQSLQKKPHHFFSVSHASTDFGWGAGDRSVRKYHMLRFDISRSRFRIFPLSCSSVGNEPTLLFVFVETRTKFFNEIVFLRVVSSH
jgi:hypothetical protein